MDLEPLPPGDVPGVPFWTAPTTAATDWPPAASPPPRRWGRLIAVAAGAATIGAGSFAISLLGSASSASPSASLTTAAAQAPGPASPTPIPAPRFHGAAVGSVSDLQGGTFTVTSKCGGTTHTANVVTDSSTTFTRTQKGAVGDIKVGDRIVAMGARAGDGPLTASRIFIVPAGLDHRPHPKPGGAMGRNTPFVWGSVQSISNGTLTLTTPQGTESVTTGASTVVVETVASSLSAVSNGATVRVAGTPSADGATLNATRVDVVDPAVVDLGKAMGRSGHMSGRGDAHV